ncbi:hypothetical protein JXA63_04665 [Candidatus Woesebacteria bacterium]|nr:hypothetical protein [Candidatus Woesebacteria bacterium]
MQPHDLEIGPIQDTFEKLFKSIGTYFHVNPISPEGDITENDLSKYPQEKLRNRLNATLSHYGFSYLPCFLKIVVGNDSKLGGTHRSDDIMIYTEDLPDGSFRTYNFYNTKGPEQMKASFYYFNKAEKEETRGILTDEDRWYLRISTKLDFVYYLRIEREKPQ